MAIARAINDFEDSTGAFDWAAEVLRSKFEEAISLRERALDLADIEGVHGMRVAIRRLRSAIRGFLPILPRKLLKHLNAKLKEIADDLGAVRDQDVAIVALQRAIEKADDTAVKEGIESLIEDRRQMRREALERVKEQIDLHRLQELRDEFYADLAEAAAKHDRKAVSVNDAGKLVILDALDDFLKLSPSLYKPFKVKNLHRLRIAAKRLRYALELFAPYSENEFSVSAEEVAAMQTALGDLHDYDVWIADLSNHLHEPADPAEYVRYQTALWLLSEFTKKRMKSYSQALEVWQNWQSSGFLENIRQTVG